MSTQAFSQLLRQKLFYFGYHFNRKTNTYVYNNEANYVQRAIDTMGRFPDQISELYYTMRNYFKQNIQDNQPTNKIKKFFTEKFSRQRITSEIFYDIFPQDENKNTTATPRTGIDFERMVSKIKALPQSLKNSLFNEKNADFKEIIHKIEVTLGTHVGAVNTFKANYDVVNDINTKLQGGLLLDVENAQGARLVDTTQELCAKNYANTLEQTNDKGLYEKALSLCDSINESKNAKVEIPEAPVYLENPKFVDVKYNTLQ